MIQGILMLCLLSGGLHKACYDVGVSLPPVTEINNLPQLYHGL